MASGPERAQRGADLSGVSLVSFNTWPGVDAVGVLNTVINDDFAHRFQANELDCIKVLAQFRRADELDAEATYYGHRAMQEEQARGPGYFTGLLRALAIDRATMAQQLRNVNEETR